MICQIYVTGLRATQRVFLVAKRILMSKLITFHRVPLNTESHEIQVDMITYYEANTFRQTSHTFAACKMF